MAVTRVWSQWDPRFAHRHSNEPEQMDAPDITPPAMAEALADLRWVNTRLGGAQMVLSVLAHDAGLARVSQDRPLRFLDLGTGGADIPCAVVDWARVRGIPIQVTAVDRHPLAAALARDNTEAYPEIEVREADALDLNDPDGTFDWVNASLFLHHLDDGDAVRLLREMARLARRGWMVHDLARSPVSYWGLRLFSGLALKGPVFRHDAPLSVLRAFTRAELHQLVRQAGVPGVRVIPMSAYRWRLIGPPYVGTAGARG